MKDLIIIGAGPAGITAAIYAARKMMDFCVLTKDIGGQAAWSGGIENYTGYQFVTGPDLVAKFREHLNNFKFELDEGVEVVKVEKTRDGFTVKTSEGEAFTSRTLIVASGKRPRSLNVPGETEFKNKGLTYCATCDGPLFSNKVVAIIGGGNSAFDAALQMIKIASKVYLVDIAEKPNADPVMVEKATASPKLELLSNANVVEVSGNKFVTGIKIEQGGKTRDISVQGVFVEIGLIPNSGAINFVEKNEDDEIIINCAAETSYPGVFAAGDVTDVPSKQIIIAAGDGAKAAMSAFSYLSAH